MIDAFDGMNLAGPYRPGGVGAMTLFAPAFPRQIAAVGMIRQAEMRTRRTGKWHHFFPHVRWIYFPRCDERHRARSVFP
jgi:hypothetical protein